MFRQIGANSDSASLGLTATGGLRLEIQQGDEVETKISNVIIEISDHNININCSPLLSRKTFAASK